MARFCVFASLHHHSLLVFESLLHDFRSLSIFAPFLSCDQNEKKKDLRLMARLDFNGSTEKTQKWIKTLGKYALDWIHFQVHVAEIGVEIRHKFGIFGGGSV